jgi:ATP synthase protein I
VEQVGLTHRSALRIIRAVARLEQGLVRTPGTAAGEGVKVGFDPEKHGRRYRLIGSLAGIPAMLIAGALVGYFLGKWLDQRLDTAPWMQLVFFFLGMGAAIRNISRLLKQVQKDSEDL